MRKRGRPSQSDPRKIQLAFLCTESEAEIIDKAVLLTNSNMSTFVRSHIMETARHIIAVHDLKSRNVLSIPEFKNVGVSVGLVAEENDENEVQEKVSQNKESGPRFLESESLSQKTSPKTEEKSSHELVLEKTRTAPPTSRSKSLPSQATAYSKDRKYFVPAILDLFRARTNKNIVRESYWKQVTKFVRENTASNANEKTPDNLADIAYKFYKSTANYIWALNEDAFFEANTSCLPSQDAELAGWTNFAETAGFCFSFRAKASELFSENRFRASNFYQDDPILLSHSTKTKRENRTAGSQIEKFIIVSFSEDIMGLNPIISFAFAENHVETWTDEEALKQLAFGKVYSAFNVAHEGTPENQLHLYNWANISLKDIGNKLIFAGNFPVDNFDDAIIDFEFLTSGQVEWFKIENCSQQVQDDIAGGQLTDEVILNLMQQMVYDQLLHWNIVFEEKYHSNTVAFAPRSAQS